ncbi:hypothetical protein Zmor_004125 [Zophobas morio]|uniref:Uncharacterized protein n=1 Tax=Zophobas morio TaxID=2755281 RepID=A0AA38LZJ2_9CUCU|nr:hypothetical protein Zmor_004125 [Zophobas morio]
MAYLNAFFQPSLHFHFEQAIIDMFDESKKESTECYELVRAKKYNDLQKDGTVVLKNEDLLYQLTVTSFEKLEGSLMYYCDDGEVKLLTDEIRNQIQHMGHDYVVNGFRPLAVCSKIITDENLINNNDLMFEGIIVFKDLVRESVYDTLAMFKKYQIDFKVLTGDSLDVSKRAVSEIGFDEIKTLTGDELIEMTPDELQIFINGVNLFAKLSPIQKSLVIHDFVKMSEVVAYIGDGTNDIHAIKKADVGIVPNTSTPLAKKFADIIMIDKNLTNFEEPIK